MATPHSLSRACSSATTATQGRQATDGPAPSPFEQDAINALLSFPDAKIFAFLAVVRSIKPSFECRSDAGPLSEQQLGALSCLSLTSDDEIRALLLCSRRRSDTISVHSARLSQASTLADSRLSRTSTLAEETLLPSALTSTLESLAENLSSESESFSDEPALQTLEKGILELNKPVTPPPLESHDLLQAKGRRSSNSKQAHSHWSSSRHNRLYTTCDGFRRQENEQEMSYVLMPFGSIEGPPHEPRCTLCQISHPSENHLEQSHGIVKYINNPQALVKKSRKGEFIKLLKSHNVTDEGNIKRLVAKWHYIQPKKAYSCGLCIKLLSTLSDRTHHYCHDHFHRGENMDAWDDTNVIKGLLLQPDLNDEYLNLFAIDPSRKESRFTWHPSVARHLQERLEFRRETPQELICAAFNSATRVPTSSDGQTAMEAGNPFSAGNTNFAAAPSALPQGVFTGAMSIPNSTYLSTSTDSVHTMPDMQQQHEYRPQAGLDTDVSASAAPSANLTHPISDPTAVFPPREDSLAFDPYDPPDPAIYGQGSFFGQPSTLDDFTQPAVDDDPYPEKNNVRQEHGYYIPPGSSMSDASHTLDIPAYNSTSAAHTATPHNSWSNEEQFSRLLLPGLMQSNEDLFGPKRKLSSNTAVDANSRSQTVSPMGSGTRTRDVPIFIDRSR